MSPAQDHRLVLEGRVVPFFDRCVKGIAIDMRNGKGAKLWMGDDAWRSAIWAARLAQRIAELFQTIAA